MVRILKSVIFACTLAGCKNTTYLSAEEPYSDLVGKCYALAQDTFIYENACWGLKGKHLISTKEQDVCFSKKVGSVKQGKNFIIKDVLQERYGTWGICPQLQANVYLDEIGSEVVVNVPICMAFERLSWLSEGYGYVWEKGRAIELDSQYAVPCFER